MKHKSKLFLSLVALGVGLPLLGDENLKPQPETVATQRLDFAAGGTIRVDGSYGPLDVEGWDQSVVEMTVIRFLPFETPESERSTERMESVRVVAERRSATELVVSTTLPERRSVFSPLWPRRTKNGVDVEVQLHVPSKSRLVIRHDVGSVTLSGIAGDIEATCQRGDLQLWLPENGAYSIDARSRLGKVSSDFPGDSLSQFLVGQKFTSSHSEALQRLYLRVGFGGITLKPMLREPEAAFRR